MNNAVSLVNYACPICGKTASSEVLMSGAVSDDYREPETEEERESEKKRFEAAAKYVESLNNQTIGYADKCCEECAKYKDDAIFFIAIDPKQSEPNNPYRTGPYVGIKKDSKITERFKDFINTLKDGTQFVFVEEEAGKQLGLWK